VLGNVTWRHTRRSNFALLPASINPEHAIIELLLWDLTNIAGFLLGVERCVDAAN
jgi:hypothetical protein